ncbi:siderophore ABC transporter substrate-binding protein [Achromobacter animicus]|uniref:siderophore ABC transporter substrate-binding protein n=1 Tax=Achromobacter animicus TaxID=1389935 RepID=UPI00244D48E0|nr:siderophore ABC transporter substrate-binding protein [Achromobacter animicus]MDH0683037.1 siderophore ABC transporter substrate-binding protein [Achromobacter animicus]
MRLFNLLFQTFWTVLLSTSCALAVAGQAVQVKHKGVTVEVSADPHPLIVFDPGVMDTLNTLGVRIEGIPEAKWYGALAKFNDRHYLRTGSLFEPDYEAVHAAKPALVIVADRSAPKYEQLSRIATTVDLTSDPKDLVREVHRQTRMLARLFDKDQQGEQALARLDASIEKLRHRAAGAGTGLIVMTAGGKLSAYGAGSRFGVLHDSFGVQLADPALQASVHGQVISNEYIAELDPDWLFVIDRDAALGEAASPAQQLMDNELIRQTTAWQSGHLVFLEPVDWYMSGLSGVGAMPRSVDALLKVL